MEELNKNINPVWKCTVCGKENIGNFCTQCGTRKPEISVTPVMPTEQENTSPAPAERTIPADDEAVQTAEETAEKIEEAAGPVKEAVPETAEPAEETAPETAADEADAAVQETVPQAEETEPETAGETVPQAEETVTAPETVSEPLPEKEPVIPAEEKKEPVKPAAPVYTETAPRAEREVPVRTKTASPLLTALLAGLIGLASGFGGGYLAVQKFAGGSAADAQETPAETAESEPSASAETQPAPQTVPAVIPAASDGTLTIQEIAAKAAPSVVEIVVETETQSFGMFGGSYLAQAAGSGVIISEDGYIITNNHVVDDATFISVTLYDGTVYEASLVGKDSKGDIAVIKIEAEGLPAAVIGDSDDILVGDLAVVIGNPLGTLGGTVTDGIISAKDREITLNNETMNLLQTNAAINNGNSGGGLFDSHGRLIGIVNAKDSGITNSGATIEGLGFAIPINDAMKIANDLMTNGVVTNRPYIGISLQTVTQSNGQYEAGLYIVGVVEGSGADQAGLKYGDRIIAADGKEISSYTELSAVLLKKEIGDTLNLTIVRDNEQMDVSVTLTEVITDGTVKEE